MARSDTDELIETPGTMDIVQKMQEAADALDPAKNSGINSGNFMVSCVDDGGEEEDKGSENSDITVPAEVIIESGFDFQSFPTEPSTSYQFGDTPAIDASLSTLFQCMTLAYSGKLTSPKWKNFKGIKLRLKEKIRLNNIIWREWHMQFIYGQSPIVCHFEPPISDKSHQKAEAIVLEGKYWKRRLESVTSEYKKWRLFYKDRQLRDRESPLWPMMSEDHLLQQVAMMDTARAPWQLASTKLPASLFDPSKNEDDELMDFSDTLFTTLNQQNFTFPNPREISGLGNADIMQPGLVQLQPNFDELMDTFDVHELMSNPPASYRQDVSSFFGLSSSQSASTSYSAPSLFSRPTTATSTRLSNHSLSNDLSLGLGTSSSNNSLFQPQPPPQPKFFIPQEQMQQQQIQQQPQTLQQQSQLQGAGPSLLQQQPQPLSSLNQSNLPVQVPEHRHSPPQVPNYQTQIQSQRVELPSQNIQSPLQLTRLPPAQVQQGGTLQVQQQVQNQSIQASQLISLVLQQHQQSQQQQESQIKLQQLQQFQQQQQQNSSLQHQIQQQQTHLHQQTQLQPQQQQFQRVVVTERQPESVNNQARNLQYGRPSQSQINKIQTHIHTQLQSQQPLLPKREHQPPLSVQLGGVATGVSPVVQVPNQQNGASHQPQTFTIIQSPSQLQTFIDSLNSQVQGQTHQVLDASSLVNALSQSQQVPSNNSSIVQNLVPVSSSAAGYESKDNSGRRASTGSVNAFLKNASKKEVGFLVPKPISGRGKQRNLAPAPPGGKPPKNSPIAQQNTFLAQLLTKGTYPNSTPTTTRGRNLSGGGRSTSAPTFTPPLVQHSPSTKSLPDFQNSVVLPGNATVLELLGQAPSPQPNDQTQSGPASPPSPQNSFSAVASPIFSVASPGSDGSGSPGKTFRTKTGEDRQKYNEHRRVTHTTAEQKRRYNIKEGFDILQELVPALKINPTSKISKANTLNKTAEFLAKLKDEKQGRQRQLELLKQEVEALNASISLCQQQLPATGAPVTRQRADQMRNMFDEYVRRRTLQNWKFWVFSIIMRPLFDSYNNTVSTASMDDMCRTVLTWLEQHCSLVTLRPGVLNSLCQLSTSTSILSDPTRVGEQAIQAVTTKQLKDDPGNASNDHDED